MIATVLPLFLQLALPEVPAPPVDLGLSRADLVLVGRAGGQGSRWTCTILETWKGTPGAEVLPFAPMEGACFPVRPPRDGGLHVFFLKRSPLGLLPLQFPGLQRPHDPNSPGGRAFKRLVDLCRAPARFPPGRAGKERTRSNTQDLLLFALSTHARHPGLAASALLALARRPDLAPGLGAAERNLLLSLLDGTAGPTVHRDLSARILVASGEPRMDLRLSSLLARGRASGLGPLFGRLLRKTAGERCVPLLAEALDLAPEPGRREVVLALEAVGSRPARELLEKHRKGRKALPRKG